MDMKKKIMSITLASVIAVTAFGLSACGNDDNNDNNNGGEAGIKSERVASAEAWAAAFDVSEVKNATIKLVTAQNDDEKKTTDIYYFDGNKGKLARTYSNGTDIEGEFVSYWEYKTDEIYDNQLNVGTEYRYTYDEEAEKWNVRTNAISDIITLQYYITKEFDELTKGHDETNDRYVGNVSEIYADFTYDNNSNAYVAKYERFKDGENVLITVKIQNGKFVYGKISGDMVYGDKTITLVVECSIYDIGTTVVTLPTVE